MSLRRLFRATALALLAVPLTAVSARAADASAFARLVATRYQVDAHHVITADIDRDGDLDVLAATDRGFMVWVNDGAGRFTSAAPHPRPLVDGQPAGNEWSGNATHDGETIQNDAPSGKVADTIHAPPRFEDSGSRHPCDSFRYTGTSRGGSAPRAPPVAQS
jgi:hypothetical protein